MSMFSTMLPAESKRPDVCISYDLLSCLGSFLTNELTPVIQRIKPGFHKINCDVIYYAFTPPKRLTVM